MNKRLIPINRLAAAALFLAPVLLPSCMHDDYGGCEPDSGGDDAYSYVSLSFSIPSSAGNYAPKRVKANPGGGEQGDGEEAGQPLENRVKKAVAFLYDGHETVNSKPETPVTVVEFDYVHTDTENPNKFTTGIKPVRLPYGSYRVLVAVNHPDLSWARNDATLTLGEVRDHIETAAWQRIPEEGETDFLMASAGEADPLVLVANSDKNPATTSVNVERVAARIDYKENGIYECGDQSGTVKVLGAAIVNSLTKGTYLLKRVADDTQGTNPEYLGDERADAQGVPENYVIDPYTAQKTTGWTEASTLYAGWFGGEINPDPNYWDGITKPGTALTAGGETWRRVGYTLENITDRQYSDKRYNTGIVFKARFTPEKVVGADDYQEGTTFFAKGSTLFATMEAMMAYTYGEKVFEGFAAQINACKDWNAVKAFAATLQDNDPSGYRQYLEKKADEALAAGSTLTDEAKSKLQWPAYMLAECGYSQENGKVTLDRNEGVSTREALQPFGVRTYEDGICYYVWWVRHGNDNDEAQTGIMEYAIVRNNVYKINVRSFYTLGGDVPGEEEPVVEVYVKDWTLLPQEDLPM